MSSGCSIWWRRSPDLTLEEIRDRLRREKKLAVATSSV
jgi:hypothetical protein